MGQLGQSHPEKAYACAPERNRRCIVMLGNWTLIPTSGCLAVSSSSLSLSLQSTDGSRPEEDYCTGVGLLGRRCKSFIGQLLLALCYVMMQFRRQQLLGLQLLEVVALWPCTLDIGNDECRGSSKELY